MLTVTPEQLAAFQSSLGREFEQRVAERIEAVFPDQMARVKAADGGGKDAVLAFVRDALQRAEKLGLERERDLVTFVVVLLSNAQLQGKEVGFFAWARPLFERPNTPSHVKIAMIEQRLQTMRKGNPLAERICRFLEATGVSA